MYTNKAYAFGVRSFYLCSRADRMYENALHGCMAIILRMFVGCSQWCSLHIHSMIVYALNTQSYTVLNDVCMLATQCEEGADVCNTKYSRIMFTFHPKILLMHLFVVRYCQCAPVVCLYLLLRNFGLAKRSPVYFIR